MKITEISFKNISDTRGSLVAIEGRKDIPFNIKRIYYIYNLNEERRGFHAHKNLQQVMLCVNGTCKVLLDDGSEELEYQLGNPAVGILIDSNIWHEMYDFSDNAVVLVLASDYYDESDYIRDYSEFLEYVK